MKRYSYKRKTATEKFLGFLSISLMSVLLFIASIFAYRYYTDSFKESDKIYTQAQMQDFVDDAVAFAKEECELRLANLQNSEKETKVAIDRSSDENLMRSLKKVNIKEDRSSKTFKKLEKVVMGLTQRELKRRKERLLSKLNKKQNSKRSSIKKSEKNLKIHIVKKGDTIYNISRSFYGTPKAIKKIIDANPKLKKNPNILKVGEKITLPI
jgi:LysM repeat protein